jgi:tetratricopeptide (TPR) repeat protein
LGNSEAEIATYDELIRRFGKDSTSGVYEQVAKALLDKGYALGKLGKLEAEVALYDELIQRFGDDPTPEVREQVIKALFNKGYALDEGENYEAALVAYDELIRRFGDDPTDDVRRQVAQAHHNKGYIFNQLDKHEAALAAYDELILRFGDDSTSAIQIIVNWARINKAALLHEVSGKAAETLAIYDNVTKRLGDAADDLDAESREQRLSALKYSVEPLLVVGRNSEALARISDALRHPHPDCTPEDAAVLHFLRWVATPDAALADLLHVFRALPPGTEISWTLPAIRRLAQSFPEPRKTQAGCLLDFLEEHRSIEKLDACLANQLGK